MALQDPQAEPSMEDILASIRRIISEDGAPPPMDEDEPILELSQPAEPEPPPRMPEPPPAVAPVDESDLLVFDEPPPQPMREAVAHAESIISEPTVTAAAQAFTRLAGTLKLSEAAGQTLEGIVRELLRPMLRDWLEANLPAIVESKVEAELDRISRLAR